MKDPYQVLGVARDADQNTIKKAFRKLAKKLHPDLNPGNKKVEQEFKEVNAAYDLLSDREKRGRFDRGEIDASGAERPDRAFYRAYAEGGGNTKYRQAEVGDSFAEDILSELFGRARGGRGQRPVRLKGEDVNYSLTVGFIEAALGTKKRVTLADGKTIDVTIPPGTEDRQTLRLKGQGLPGMGGGPPGDAYVEIRVEPHPFFSRKDSNVHLELPVTLPEAVLGASVTVPTVDGKVSVKIPPGSNTGTMLRLKGRGILDRKTGRQGDQYVTLKVMLPDQPNQELTRFLEEWSKRHPYDVRTKLGLSMRRRLDEILAEVAMSRQEIEYCLSESWVLPERQGEELAFDDVDLARLRLIAELKRDFAVNDEAVPLVLRLIDELHLLHHCLDSVAEALERVPDIDRGAVQSLVLKELSGRG